jgi:transposase
MQSSEIELLICKEYIEHNKSIIDLAKQFHVSRQTVGRVLNRQGVSVRRRPEVNIDDIVNDYCGGYGLTRHQLAQKYNRSPSRIRVILQSRGVLPIMKSYRPSKRMSIEDKVCAAVRSGLYLMREISAKFKVSINTIRDIRRRNNLPLYNRGIPINNPCKDKDISRMIKDRAAGMSWGQMTEKYNRSRTTILKLIRDVNIQDEIDSWIN